MNTYTLVVRDTVATLYDASGGSLLCITHAERITVPREDIVEPGWDGFDAFLLGDGFRSVHSVIRDIPDVLRDAYLAVPFGSRVTLKDTRSTGVCRCAGAKSRRNGSPELVELRKSRNALQMLEARARRGRNAGTYSTSDSYLNAAERVRNAEGAYNAFCLLGTEVERTVSPEPVLQRVEVSSLERDGFLPANQPEVESDRQFWQDWRNLIGNLTVSHRFHAASL